VTNLSVIPVGELVQSYKIATTFVKVVVVTMMVLVIPPLVVRGAVHLRVQSQRSAKSAQDIVPMPIVNMPIVRMSVHLHVQVRGAETNVYNIVVMIRIAMMPVCLRVQVDRGAKRIVQDVARLIHFVGSPVH